MNYGGGFIQKQAQPFGSGAKLFSGNSLQQTQVQGQGKNLVNANTNTNVNINKQIHPQSFSTGRKIFSGVSSHSHKSNSSMQNDQMVLDGAAHQFNQLNQINQPQKSGKSIFSPSVGNLQQTVHFVQTQKNTGTGGTPNIFVAASSSLTTPNLFLQNYGQQNVFNPNNIFGPQNLLKQSQSKTSQGDSFTPTQFSDAIMSDDLMMAEDNSENFNYNNPQSSQITLKSNIDYPVKSQKEKDIISIQPSANLSQIPQPSKKEIKTLEDFEDEVRRMFDIRRIHY